MAVSKAEPVTPTDAVTLPTTVSVLPLNVRFASPFIVESPSAVNIRSLESFAIVILAALTFVRLAPSP